MNIRPASLPGAVACIDGIGEYLRRSGPRTIVPRMVSPPATPWVPPHLEDLTPAELADARSIAKTHGFRMAEAADIVRRSRR